MKHFQLFLVVLIIFAYSSPFYYILNTQPRNVVILAYNFRFYADFFSKNSLVMRTFCVSNDKLCVLHENQIKFWFLSFIIVVRSQAKNQTKSTNSHTHSCTLKKSICKARNNPCELFFLISSLTKILFFIPMMDLSLCLNSIPRASSLPPPSTYAKHKTYFHSMRKPPACLCSISKIFQLEIKLSKLEYVCMLSERQHKLCWWKKKYFNSILWFFEFFVWWENPVCASTKNDDEKIWKQKTIYSETELALYPADEPGRHKKKRNAMNSLIHKHVNEWTRASGAS